MYEYKITSKADRALFESLAQAIMLQGGKMIEPEDENQFNSSLDQMYIDFDLAGKTITLHYEHYLGISLLSKEVDVEKLANISLTI